MSNCLVNGSLLSDSCTWVRLELSRQVTSDRFAHSLSVSWTADYLARLHGVEPHRASLAGLLHDYARDLGSDRLLDIADSQHLVTSVLEEQYPILLHGKVAAHLAQSTFGITDSDVLQAIAFHPVGSPDLGEVGKTLYVADYIEPLRCFPGLQAARALARVDLEAAVDYKLVQTSTYLRSRGFPLHPLSEEMLRTRGLSRLLTE